MFVRFGQFQFDSDANGLLERGQLVHLTPRAAKLLGILLANRPLPVKKGELERQIWPGTFVAETNLANVVLELRRTLKGGEKRGFIKTVHGVGYAFIGDACGPSAPPAAPGVFRLGMGGLEIGLSEGENWIGRATECRVQVACPLASRRHACIVVEGSQVTLRDGGSRNGTFLNAHRLASQAKLRSGDRIEVGSIDLRFRIVRPDALTEEIGQQRSARASDIARP